MLYCHTTRQLAMHACYVITQIFEKLLVMCRITASVCTNTDPDWTLNGMQANPKDAVLRSHKLQIFE